MLSNSCKCFFVYYQQCFELPWMNMYECICCLFHIFPTNMFLDIGIGSFPDALSPHNFEVSINHVRPKYQPQSQPEPFKLIILFVNNLLCSHSPMRVRQKAIMHFNGHNNFGRLKLGDLKVCPTLLEFKSLLLHNFHVVVWSCIEDVVIHNVLRCLFLENVIYRLALYGANWSAQIQMGSLVETCFLPKKEVFLGTTKIYLVAWRAVFCLLMISLANTSRRRPRSVATSPTLWPGPRVIDNISTTCDLYIKKLIHTPIVPLYLGICIWGIVSQMEYPQFHVNINGVGCLWLEIACQTQQKFRTN